MATINGTANNDTLTIVGGKSNDILLGLEGNDYLDALPGAGNNILKGGDGNDELYAYTSDQLFGEAGNDTLTSDGNGKNTLDGGEGDDTIYGDRDTIGNDVLIGGAGNDLIYSGLGGNTITGGSGTDTIWLANVDLPTRPNTITDFDPRNDFLRVNLAQVNKLSDLTIAQAGADTTVSFGSTQIVLLKNTTANSLNATNISPVADTPLTVNLAPTAIVFSNTVTKIAENTANTVRTKIADLAITDGDARGTNNLSVSGTEASSFELDGTALYLKANTNLDFETKSSYAVTVNVDDPTIGSTPDAKLDFVLAVTDVNEAPTGSPTYTFGDIYQNSPVTVSDASLLAGFKDVDAGSVLKVDKLTASNGAIVTNSGNIFTVTPASNFLGKVDITYNVSDGTNALTGQTLSFTVLPPINLPPTAIVLSNTITKIAENTANTTRTKLADIAITDDGRGTNNLSLSGADASNYELDGTVLYLKANTKLDFETKNSYAITINTDDPAVGNTPDAKLDFVLAVTDVNEAPTGSPSYTLSNTYQNSPITVSTASLLAGFKDVDAGSVLTVDKLTASDGATITSSGGIFTITPANNFVGKVDVTYNVTDGTNTLTAQTLKFAVLPPVLETVPTNLGILQMSQGGGKTSSMIFTKISHQAGNRNELGVFAVDDNSGVVNGVAPGQSGYLAEVLKRSQVVFSALSGSAADAILDAKSTRTLNLPTNAKLGFYIAADSSIDDAPSADKVLFSFPSLNNTFQNSRITQSNGITQIAFEDNIGGGDKDFDDLVIQIQNNTGSIPLGVGQQGTREIFDLVAVTTPVKATFEIKRDAGYEDHIGFYKIEDIQGTIKVGTTLLKPGDAGYRQAAVQGRIAGIDLVGINGQTAAGSGTFQGGALYAPLLISNASVANADFSNVYTAYNLGNADKADHIRLLGDNTFGFEDLAGGGDRDFNDVIVKATFQ
jgi:Cadherin-like domain/Domain of unknown function (DUF4114)/RTX calcium-binding nonapeptide repeat (4 copies)